MNKYGYIYCTTDLKNGMKYIGQKKSDIFISNYFGSGKIIKNKLKARPNDFKVDLIEWCYSKEELNNYENDWTHAVGLYPESYNLCYGGGTLSGYKHTTFTIIKMKKPHKKLSEEAKISKSRSGKISNMKGKNHTDESKKKMSKIKIGIKHTNEHNQKIAQKKKGHVYNKNRVWYTNGIVDKFCFELPDGFKKGRSKNKKEIA